MANISLTPGVDAHDKSHSKIRKLVTYTGPASYLTGGDPVLASDFGLGAIDMLVIGDNAWNGSAVRLVAFDEVNNKLVWYVPNTGAEVAAAQDLSGYTVSVEAIGH